VQLVKEYRFPEVGSSGRPIVMSAGNKLFRRFLVGGVPALSFFLHCGTALNGLNASPSPAWTFPAERDRADLSLEAGMWRSEFQWADSKKSPDDTSGKSDTPMTANNTDAAFSGLTAAVDCFENESLLDTEASSVNRDVQHPLNQTMTDWENAIFNADGVQKKTMSAQGPSAVTAVVTVVGAVVVFGAYCKSSGR
jgi:hypothetical protein